MNEFSYPAIPAEYKPTIGNARSARPTSRASGRGPTDYADLPFLREMIKALIEETEAVKAEASDVLREFNLTIQPQSRLLEAQTQITGISETPDHVSFDEYKTVSTLNHRAAGYIKHEYEYSMRGASGHNALDVYTIASIVNNEARNIDDFITNYLGDMNDSSEYRTVELFQDWAKASFEHTGALRYFLAARDALRNKLSVSEVAQISSDRSRQHQAVFQAKLNVINKQFETELESFKKENGALADVFYKRIYGPALYFRTRVMKDIEPRNSSEVSRTVLGNEMLTAQASLNANFAGILTDHLRRNQLYTQRIDGLFQKMQARSAYRGYIDQLSGQGLKRVTPFIPADSVKSYENIGYIGTPLEEQDPWVSEHDLLDGTENDDAHPQYILRDGGSVLSDLYVEPGVKIAGVDLPAHSHKGLDVDGTAQISGADIEEGSISEALLNSAHMGVQPSNLNVKQQEIRNKQGVVQVDTTLAWKQNPAERFELQIVPAESYTPPPSKAFIEVNHNWLFSHFTTEDSNFLSLRDTTTSKFITLDANHDTADYQIGSEDIWPNDLKFVAPIRLESVGSTTYVDSIEVGTDVYYISPDVGVFKTALMSSAEVKIHTNSVKIYGSERVVTKSCNLCYDSINKKLYWFDIFYRTRDGVLNDYSSTLKSYDPITKKLSDITSYPTLVNGAVNDRYLFTPSVNAIYHNSTLYVSAVAMSIDTNDDLVFLEPIKYTFLKIDPTTGAITETDVNADVAVHSMLYHQGKVFSLVNDPALLAYEVGANDPANNYRRLFELVDTNSEITFIPRNLTDIPSAEYVMRAATADIYNNIYVNLAVPEVDRVDDYPYRIIKCGVE